MTISALDFFKRDVTLPNQLDGLPHKLSDVTGLQIGSFQTNDGVSLNYWKAGSGEPLVFVPGWSSNGAEYINLIHLLKDKFTVYVLDQRNHGLSDKVKFGNRISRFSMDLHEFLNAENIEKAHLCGWSMGCSVIWGYVDLFGSNHVKKFVFIDEAPSIYCHSNWTEEERINAGAFTTSAEMMIDMYYGRGTTNQLQVRTDIFDFYNTVNAPAFENSMALCDQVCPHDKDALEQVLFDHILNDWRDVLINKIDKPTLVVSGEHSNWVESQRWIAQNVPNGEALIYGKHEHGDHFLHLKMPQKFAGELTEFLNRMS
ncbi:alpha/beta fold hydrolase [Basfia succiniciproducens]|uniref:alpha/beta fold hydrolase n=1 Tax=Basfia succiniciproducens TaxID=653940 RepID=UPI0008B940BD|nr:alpha/beta hydrolase [Basfia succiniciproducens]SEQ68263.1 Pimeloyl-ACP methyl ester carboxylesterase [Basfia succiniciproducens]